MGEWINKILAPAVSPDSDNHIAIEDIARLAEGAVGNAERRHLIRHINRCRRCYEILQHTLKDAPFATSAQPAAGSWWKSKAAYALAASIILIFAIGGHWVYKYWSPAPTVISATLILDQNLKDILLEDSALRFGEGARLRRLLSALQDRGLRIENLNLAVLSKPYFQKKSLFGPKEVLHIRVENDVAYLEVRAGD